MRMYSAHLVSVCIDAGKLCLIVEHLLKVRHMPKPVYEVAMKALEGGREGGRDGGREGGMEGWMDGRIEGRKGMEGGREGGRVR